MKDELFANYKTLESDRLLLRPIILDDTSDLFEIYSNKEVGLIVIPEAQVPEFKKKLVKYYEKSDIKEINKYLKDKCWRKIKKEL